MTGLYLNPGIVAKVNPLRPQGTNSTLFTECCGCAICSDERACPGCGRLVIGHDAETNSKRHKIRWLQATAHWKRG